VFRFVAEVIEDPWQGQDLPVGAAIPTKPLIDTDKLHVPKCNIM
jgi:hypothetical protein